MKLAMTKRLKWKECKYPGCDGTGNIRDPNCYPLYIEVQCPMCALHAEARAEVERMKEVISTLQGDAAKFCEGQNRNYRRAEALEAELAQCREVLKECSEMLKDTSAQWSHRAEHIDDVLEETEKGGGE